MYSVAADNTDSTIIRGSVIADHFKGGLSAACSDSYIDSVASILKSSATLKRAPVHDSESVSTISPGDAVGYQARAHQNPQIVTVRYTITDQ